MASRVTRLLKRTCLNPLLSRGRKPRILPMSQADQRENEELHRRREERRKRKDTPHELH